MIADRSDADGRSTYEASRLERREAVRARERREIERVRRVLARGPYFRRRA